MATVLLKPGREKSVLRRHPWVFSGAVAAVKGYPDSGETVKVLASNGDFLAWGAYSPVSQIRVRIWSWREDERIDPAFFYARLDRALAYRRSYTDTSAMRLVYGESDDIPGLVVDRYGDILVVQFLSTGVEHWRQTIADSLMELTGLRHIWERSDADVRRLEGLPLRNGSLRGTAPEQVRIVENNLMFHVNVHQGQKSGFYLDQAQNRRYVRSISQDKAVLDCFAYTGGFFAECTGRGGSQSDGGGFVGGSHGVSAA